MMERLQLLLQFAVLTLLVAVDAGMFWFLIDGLIIENEVQMDPAIAALIGSLAGAVTTTITLAGRSFFNDSKQA